MAEYKNLALTGAMIAEMTEADRWFEIVEEPRYEEITSFTNPDKKIDKLIFPVRLSDGKKCDYYPNLQSHKLIAKTMGTDMSKWVGTKWIWGRIVKQIVGNSGEKDVCFITGPYPKQEKAK